MPETTQTVQLSTRITPQLRRSLRLLAALRGHSQADLFRRLIETEVASAKASGELPELERVR